MILRILGFIIFVSISVIIGLILVRDLGDTRKDIEKRLKNEASIKEEQTIWQRGPKHKR